MAAELSRIEQIFNEALEKRDDGERSAYLAEACQADGELLQRVEALLAAHIDAGNQLPLHNEEPTLSFLPISERPGSTIGRYKLLEQIGEGGFGVVFMADQEQPIRRRVALKIIKAGMDTKQVVARFEAERQALALMDHPNIAKVLDAGATDTGRPYFVMELVRGTPITEYCDEARLTTEQRLELFQKVCSAVQHAHQKGVIHRDLKPSNVMVTMHDDKAVPKVIDFGVAKATQGRLTERTLFTEFRQMIGTPTYMSPEQAQLSGLDVDTRSDIYSLGVLLYELLTGTTPIESKRVASASYDDLRRLICEDEPPSPSMRLYSLSNEELTTLAKQRLCEPAYLTVSLRNDLDWIVMRCLEKNRTRRYPTANSLSQDIERYLRNEPVEARAPTQIYRLQKFVRRNKLWVGLGTLAIAALLTAVIGLSFANAIISGERNQKAAALFEKQVALEEAQRLQELAQSNAELAQKNERLAQRRLYASQMNLAMQAWRAGDRPRVLELLESQRPGPNEEDQRAFEWYYLWRLTRQGHKALVGHSRAVLSVRFSHNGRYVATASWDRTVRLWDAHTGTAVRTFHKPGVSFWEVCFSPDGKLIAAGGKESAATCVWNIESGDEQITLPRRIVGLIFSRDNSAIYGTQVIKGREHYVSKWDVFTGEVKDLRYAEGVCIGITPDEQFLVTGINQNEDPGEILIYNLKSEKLTLRIPAKQFSVAALSWNGKRIAYAAHHDPKALRIFDLVTGEPIFSPTGQDGSKRALAFSRDGKRIASGSEHRTVYAWDIEKKEKIGQDEQFESVWSLAFSPNGKTLASSTLDGSVSLWDMTSTEDATTLQVGNSSGELRFSTDGRAILAIGPDYAVSVDCSTGEIAQRHPIEHVKAVAPGGQLVFATSESGVGEILEANSGRVVSKLPTPLKEREQVALSPDGKLVAIYRPWVGSSGVVLWDLEKREKRELPNAPSPKNLLSVLSAAFSSDGRYLAAGYQFYSVLIWDLRKGGPPAQYRSRMSMMTFRTLEFARDNSVLAAGAANGDVCILSVEDGKLLQTLHGDARGVPSLAFTPDKSTLAVASADGSIRLCDPRYGQEKVTLTGHASGVGSVVFSPDGQTLASQSYDGVLKLWKCADTPDAHARRAVPQR